MLINRIEIIINKIGTKRLLLINEKLNSLKLKISGIKTKTPPAGEGIPSKKLSLHDGSSLEFTLNLASLNATETI